MTVVGPERFLSTLEVALRLLGLAVIAAFDALLELLVVEALVVGGLFVLLAFAVVDGVGVGQAL